ncbi:beta-glucosidase [Sphingomonas sp. S2-65]|uniref:beta-glucosidase n=1 Tax=Sphingomonas sp. S2-65 TaxID=2903960 RepID=UPI001F289A4C|nr:glycoside hydrolase family 3 C-terminal domain-containing protein [Sphingomonas sp. S2-65]UYY59476.1 glycoside hydrolase family 3 C-terminal domain-containing protein [Sphingomonas sp. S2-65]
MKVSTRSRQMYLATSVAVLALATPAAAQQAQAPQDAAATAAEQRAETLSGQMTREEQLRYVHGYFPPMSKDQPADMIPSAGYVPGIPRLGIPTLRESDASLGVANQIEQRKGDVATALPASLALAASFDPDLAYRGGVMIGSEARAKTFNVLLAGGVNLTRDPWGGRTFEYLGEDPLLAGIMAGESIRGVQANHIVSTVKHFAINPQETLRTTMDAKIDEASLRESDLLAFEIAIERGRPGSVMCAYNKINTDWACENDWLLNQVLKRDWGYKGWVMSDWGAVHSTVKAANAGLDQQSGRELDKAMYLGKPLADAVANGSVSPERLRDMNRRILWGVTTTGLIDHPVPLAAQPIDYAANARVAQEVAEKGSVLLKNQGNLLPLARTAKKIVLIGAHADVGVLSGGGSSQVRSVGGAPVEIPLTEGAASSFARVTWHASSPLTAIRAMAPGAEVSYIDGRDPAAAAAAARGADLAIVFAWQWRTEAQDIETLSLPDNQDALIEAVAGANKRTAVVLETGGPVLMPWLGKVPAVLQAWYPGQKGGEAIANLLFGAANPSGKLPMTFVASEAQAPRHPVPGLADMKAADAAKKAGGTYGMVERKLAPVVPYAEGAAVGYRSFLKTGQKPLFPFGYGLSYTQFRYAGLKVEGGRELRVSFDVTNTGRVAGADTPQVYATAGRRDGATARLVGFERVMLQPGETRRVQVAVDPRLIADYDVAGKRWHVAAGTYPVTVGHHAGDAALSGRATLIEAQVKP